MGASIPSVTLTIPKIERFLKQGGPNGVIPIAILPKALGSYIKSRVRIVRLYHEVASKIARKHRLLPEHFLLVPLAFDMAWLGSDRKRHLVFLYEDTVVFNKTFKVVVKTRYGGDELILQTLHKAGPPDIRSIKKRCAKIRDQKFIEPETGSGSPNAQNGDS